MAGRPRRAITLSRSERTKLKRLSSRYSAPYGLVIRARIVLLAAQGVRTGVIADKHDLPRQVVLRWIVRFQEERLPGLADRPRSGRPRLDGRDQSGR